MYGKDHSWSRVWVGVYWLYSPIYANQTYGSILLGPAHGIIGIFDGQGIHGQLQGMEGIDHYGQFFGFFGANAFFHRPGMWAMGDTAWVQGDHTPCYVLAAHKITVYIIQQFIAVDIAVVIRRRDGLGMIIE